MKTIAQPMKLLEVHIIPFKKDINQLNHHKSQADFVDMALDHTLQHLGRHDHGLALVVGCADDALLNEGHVFGWHLDSKVATRDHHAVRGFQNT